VSHVVELARVHARDAAGPEGRPRGSLSGLSLALGAGVHAFLGAPEDGTLALAEVISGARAPLRGTVSVVGRNPAAAPSLRARIGALGAEPRLPPASTVRAAVRLALRARGETGDRFDAVLDPLGLSPLQARDPRSLSFAELRAVELAIALSTPAPRVLALHEPLADVAMPRLDLLPLRLREAAGAGCAVLITTSSPADARALADHVLVLHRGLVAREARGGGGLTLGAGVTLRAWVRATDRDGARALAAALAVRPEVRAVSWHESAVVDDGGLPPPKPPGEPLLVSLSGDDAEPCALALAECVLESGAEIEALTEDAPTLGDVRASTEALWRSMASRPAAPPPAPPPPAPPKPPDEPERVATPPPAPAEEAAAVSGPRSRPPVDAPVAEPARGADP
jgi:ABC-2 type transport system ATP-binding protein